MPLRIAVIGTIAVAAAGGAFALVKAGGSKHPSAAATSPAATHSRAGGAPSSAASASPSPSPSPEASTSSPASPSPSESTSAGGGLAGTWNGTWRSNSIPATGGFQMSFTLNGKQLKGAITVQGGCFSHGSVDGAASGNQITFGAIKAAGVSIAFTGKVHGDRMSGTYTTGESCGSDTGTWKATRAAA
jgi:hypothetical protein